MKRFCVVAVGIAIAMLPVAPATAQTPEQTVGSTLIKFPVPAGRCEVSDRTPAGAFFNKLMRESLAAAGNTLFSIHADCDQLERYSAGATTGIADYATYNTPNAAVNMVPPSDVISRVCTGYRSVKSEDV